MISMSLTETATVLNANYDGADDYFYGCSTDTRTLQKGQLFIAIRGERFDGHDYLANAKQQGAVAALVEKTVNQPLAQIRVNDSRRAMGELAGHWRARFRIPLVAVTGSNGKTTVKEMLGSILAQKAPVLTTRGNLNNDIGVPLTLFGLGDEHRYAVIEMGANHPGEISWLSRLARPSVAVITQCAPAHLEGFGSIEGVAKGKAEIYEGLLDDGVAIINADDDYAGLWHEKIGDSKTISFGLGSDADITATEINYLTADGKQSFSLVTPVGKTRIQLALPGRHNIMNALAAAACASALNIDIDTIKTGLEQLQPGMGRLQIKPGIKGLTILDDTYNANPVSLQAAIDVMSLYQGEHWVVLGDMGELGVEARALHADAGELAKQKGVKRLFGLGPLSEAAVGAFADGAEHFEDMDLLIEHLKSLAGENIIMLVKGSRAMQMERIVNALQESRTC